MPPLHTIHTLFRGSTLKILDYRCSGEERGKAEEEWPDTFQIALPRRGVYVHRDARGTVVADPNQVIFFNRNQPYEVTHPLPGGDASTVFILKEGIVRELLEAAQPWRSGESLPSFAYSHLTVKTPLRLWQFWLLQAGRAIPAVDALAVEEIALTLLGQLVTAGSAGNGRKTAVMGRSASTQRAHADLAHDAMMYLNGRASESISLAGVAGAVHTSPFHLCRVFRQVTGCTLYGYLQRLRLLDAAERMADAPGQSLARVAVDCGFASHSHLSSAFRQAFGLSPSQFRRAVADRGLREMRKILKV